MLTACLVILGGGHHDRETDNQLVRVLEVREELRYAASGLALLGVEWSTDESLLQRVGAGGVGEGLGDVPGDPLGTPAAPNLDLPALICAYAWPCDEALRVVYGSATCPNGESGGKLDAVSDDGQNLGPFQLNVVHAGRVGGDPGRLLDPATNVRIAFELYSEQGWRPWACKP